MVKVLNERNLVFSYVTNSCTSHYALTIHPEANRMLEVMDIGIEKAITHSLGGKLCEV